MVRVPTKINFVSFSFATVGAYTRRSTSSSIKIDRRKARERESLATFFDENRRAVSSINSSSGDAEPYQVLFAIKMKARAHRGAEGTTPIIPVTTACPEDC